MDYSINKGTELDFVFGGNAIFTLRSKQTGRRYTYKVTKAKNKDYYIAKVFYGGDDNQKDYKFIGILTKDGLTNVPTKVTQSSYYILALNYFIDRAYKNNIPKNLEVYHAGRCCHCGRLLTTPESIERGVGPKCEKFIRQIYKNS